MKANIKQLVASATEEYARGGITPAAHPSCSIDNNICTLWELQELIDLIPDGAIEQAIQDQDDKDTAETIRDFESGER